MRGNAERERKPTITTLRSEEKKITHRRIDQGRGEERDTKQQRGQARRRRRTEQRRTKDE